MLDSTQFNLSGGVMSGRAAQPKAGGNFYTTALSAGEQTALVATTKDIQDLTPFPLQLAYCRVTKFSVG